MFPLLPKLKDSSAVNPDKSSEWESKTKDFLTALVQSLSVGGTIKDLGHIDSIPDVWARPLLFQMALFDAQTTESQQFVHGLHDRVKGEWRALLAMLALKDVKHLNIRAEAVSLGNGRETDTLLDLEAVLASLAPAETVSRATRTDWSNLYVFFFQEKLIALTSPTTLMCTAADYQAAFGGRLPEPWSQDGETLTDPIPYLTKDDLKALFTWLHYVYEELRRVIPPQEQQHNDILNALLRNLADYMKDIERQGGREVTIDLPMTDANLRLTSGIFRLMNQTVQAQGTTAQDSAVRLIVSGLRRPKQDILLVSPEMVRDFADQIGIPATQLVVWMGLSANDISEAMLSGEHNKIGNISLAKAEYRRPEEFFTERMAVMEPGNAILGSRLISGVQLLAEDELSVILPIRRELLDYFGPQEIAERLIIENTLDDIAVQFSFPLSGVDGRPMNYKFTKRYPKKDLIYLQTNVPVIEIWPNIRREGWTKYYLYYENSEGQTQSREVGKDYFYVEPWAYGKDSIASELPNHGMANRYTAKMDSFPEALICTVNAAVPGSAYAQPVEAGLLLLAEPDSVARIPSLTWNVGIDFGTSSTMVYCRMGSQQSQPLVLAPNLFQITDSGVARNTTYLSFIPSAMDDQRNGSFLSIFHILNMENTGDKIKPLQDGHVFWLTTSNESTFAQLANTVDANLKWKDDANGRRRVAAYVKQICLQSLVEAAKNGADKVTWNFSYPTAFSKEQQFAFQETCREAVVEAYEDSGFVLEGTPEIWSESKAAAYHFNKLGGRDTNFSDGAICLDIGAGTSDVSIISGQPGRIAFHTSFQFAGRYLFQPVYQNYALFSTRDIVRSDLDVEMRRAIIDADMREHSEEYLGNLKNNTGREEVKRVLQLSQLAMAGIFYYLGLTLDSLHAKNVYREGHVPDIYIGGNGSRIFYWLTGGVFNTESPFLGVLKRMLVVSSGLSEESRFQVHISANPKIEVASGMIETKPHNDREFYDEERQATELFGGRVDEYVAASLLAGGAYTTSRNEERGSDTFLSAHDISEGITVNSVDTLRQFVDAFNEDRNIWSDGFRLSENDWQDVRKLVNSYYVAEKGKDVKKIFVEPVFIVGMKKLMEMLQHG